MAVELGGGGGENVPREACTTIHWDVERNLETAEPQFIFCPSPLGFLLHIL